MAEKSSSDVRGKQEPGKGTPAAVSLAVCHGFLIPLSWVMTRVLVWNKLFSVIIT